MSNENIRPHVVRCKQRNLVVCVPVDWELDETLAWLVNHKSHTGAPFVKQYGYEHMEEEIGSEDCEKCRKDGRYKHVELAP